MDTYKEALFYEAMADGRVYCRLCPHDCHIGEGKRGVCGVRINHQGILYTLVYDKVVSRHLDPVEKKPLFHFQPGSTSYSIATVGCNMRCAFCQNWEISQLPKGRIPPQKAMDAEAPEPICPPIEAAAQRIIGEQVSPQEIVDAALSVGARSIAYTYTEPTIFYELAYDTAVLAKAQGLKNIFVTNGFIAEEALRQLATVLDAANVDLKFFTDENYRRISGARLQPILEAIRLYKTLGVWVEVTTLLIPGVNDSDDELRQIAAFVQSVGPEVPWHVTQFYPAYKMLDRRPTPIATLRHAREIGLEAGLRYVYEGNVPGEGGENTYCYACQTLLIRRYGLFLLSNRIRQGKCPKCGTTIDGIEMNGSSQDEP
jgi:pyruvate formate lyase activating enzyme